MVPGMRKAMKGVEVDDEAFKPIEAMINSMTDKEKSNPDIINHSRRQRIANGSGTSVQEVNKLLKQFKDTKKMMRLMSDKRNMMNMMKQFKNMGGQMPQQ